LTHRTVAQFGYAGMMAFILVILLPLQTLEMVGKENKVRTTLLVARAWKDRDD
jgi:hypothetical protein